MSSQILIDPITRLEGHGRIHIFLNVGGDVDRAYLQIPELRGFEKFAQGRRAEDMPEITSRIQKWGRIINPSSAAWLGFAPGQANYAAAKRAITSLSRVIAMENGRMGITCNCLVPMAATRMTMNDAVKANFQRQYEEGKITKQVLEDRLAMPGPEFTAPIVVYLCTDAAANINFLSFRAAGGTVGIYSANELVKTIHKDHRKCEKWTIEELEELVPKFLLVNWVNPAPPAPPEAPKK